MYPNKTISKPLLALPVIAIMLVILMPEFSRMRLLAYRTICGKNLSAIGKGMMVYSADCSQMYPTPSKWCDLLIERANVNLKSFRCKNASGDDRCNYAMNKNIENLGTKTPPDMVLLFETAPGWNRSGGPEILTTKNHHGDGCNVLFADNHVEFVLTKDLPKLKWMSDSNK